MYLRHTTRHKDGKVHTYWRLVRSVRVGRRVIQQTVAHLGELDAQGRARAKALARAILGEHEQTDLFTPPTEGEEVIPVRLHRIRLERGRTFGDVWLGWTLWRALRLDALKRAITGQIADIKKHLRGAIGSFQGGVANPLELFVKESKQAEFLVHESFPWNLVARVGVHSLNVRSQVEVFLQAPRHRPGVEVRLDWYY